MMKDTSKIINEHMQHNASADSAEEVRRRKRMAELKAEREKSQMERRPDAQSAPAQSTTNK